MIFIMTVCYYDANVFSLLVDVPVIVKIYRGYSNDFVEYGFYLTHISHISSTPVQAKTASVGAFL